jgi:DNA mismatch repair protein MSH6
VAPIEGVKSNRLIESPGTLHSSPSRKAKKAISYAESADEDDEDEVFKPLSGNRRAAKRRRISVKDDSDDEFGFDASTQAAMESDEGTYGSRLPWGPLTISFQ